MSQEPAAAEEVTPADLGAYCRALEAYLCRRNEGHLVRIVGPSFDCVAGWASRGVPFRIACRGIDRCVDRLQAKGPRRRPVRIEFCDADVRDVFDEWKRAVGIPASAFAETEDGEEAPAGRRHVSLAAHLERVVARLTALRGSGGLALGDVVDPLVTELDRLRTSAKALRGDARQAVLDRLRVLDAELVAAVTSRLDAATVDALAAEATLEVAGFRDRMPAEAFAAAEHASLERLIRDRFRLPLMGLDG